MVGLCLELNRPRQGLTYAERAKSRTLLDMLTFRVDLGIQARSAEDAPLVEELTHLRAERDQLYRRWEGGREYKVRGWTAPNGGRQEVQQKVVALEKRIEELWYKLLIRNADYARDAAMWQVRTEPVQPHLSTDTLLIEYFIAHGELIAFLITTESIQAQRLPVDQTRIKHLLQLLWLNLRAASHSTPSRVSNLAKNARGLLGQLYVSLLAPLADTLASYPQLIIVPHGPLHYLPFHALYNGQKFLIEEHEIAYLPSASFLRYVTEVELASTGCVALGHSYGGRLPHAVQEVQSVTSLLGGQALLEDDATSARLLEGLQDCRILHVAAHGDFRPDNPLFSGLALADGWLTTLDIFNLRLRASLVTLSACQTGQSVVGGGDELLGLIRTMTSVPPAGTAAAALGLRTAGGQDSRAEAWQKRQDVRIAVFDTSPFEEISDGEKCEGCFRFHELMQDVFGDSAQVEPPLTVWHFNPISAPTCPGQDVEDPELDRETQDISNHGLFVAGLAHAVAPHSAISLIRVLANDGCGDLFTIEQAIDAYIEQTLAKQALWDFA